MMVPPGVGRDTRTATAVAAHRVGARPWCVRLRLVAGLNSLPMPGTEGRGPGAFTVQAQLPDVDNIEQNSRVRVGDVNVGTSPGSNARAGTRWSQ